MSRAADARYTPPGIVAFMCREALKAHLAGTRDAPPEAIAPWIDRGDAGSLTRAQSRRLLDRLAALRVIDPACGHGAFLVGFVEVLATARRALAARLGGRAVGAGGAPGDPVARPGAGGASGAEGARGECGLYGIELDPRAAAVARRLLGQALARRVVVADAIAHRVASADAHASCIVAADALAAWPVAELPRGYDIVLVNPPYVNMVAMTTRDAGERRRLRAAYRTARGGFDLFVPFIELCIAMLARGGVLAALTPDKLLSAQYAGALREHYREHLDLLALADLRDARPFAAGVYPVITIGRRRPAPGGKQPMPDSAGVRIWRSSGRHESDEPRSDDPRSAEARPYDARSDEPRSDDARPAEALPNRAIDLRPSHTAPAGVLAAVGNRWGALLDRECETIARRLPSLPRLADLADVCGAATVAEAYAWQPAIVDRGRGLWEDDPERYAPFVVSGNIVPAGHTWAERPVRYLGRSYREPVLDLQHPAVSARRRRQIRAGKIILSGLARRPTCVWDDGGLAAGKSTVLVIPRPGVGGRELAAALNGEEQARIYRLLFGSLALSGGYLRFGPPQMRELPVLPMGCGAFICDGRL